MAEGIDRTSQILAYVLDSLQVVSYKWLSRKLSISSNESKRLLQNVADEHASDLDIIYAVSGWSKTDHHCYSVKLVPKSKLQEATDMLSGHVSIHVYSIQPCTPKDPAELWGAEYVQSEDLFKQPSETSNCLRDNRFSGVVCTYVTRRVKDKVVTGSAKLASSKATAQSPAASITGAPLIDATKVATPSTSPPHLSVVKAEVAPDLPPISGQARQNVMGNTSIGMAAKGLGSSVAESKGAIGAKKKPAGSGDGRSLANLWGRATTKPKPLHTENEAEAAAAVAAVKQETGVMNHSCIDGSSEDEGVANFPHPRRSDSQSKSKRTRRMIVDDDISDNDDVELEDKTVLTKFSPEKLKVQKERETSVEPEKKGKKESKEKKKPNVPEQKGKSLNVSGSHLNVVKENPACLLGDTEETKLDAVNDRIEPSGVAANGTASVAHEPKKRKVLKTRMDEKGREVTEVVWETENSAENASLKVDNRANVHGEVQLAPTNNASSKSNVKASSASIQNPANKGSGGGKSSGKGGASKDSQQGRISSFFKKKN